MLDAWTGEVVGKMHVNCVSNKDLAKELGWNVKYLSAVLNCHRKPAGVEEKVKIALNKCISNQGVSANYTSAEIPKEQMSQDQWLRYLADSIKAESEARKKQLNV